MAVQPTGLTPGATPRGPFVGRDTETAFSGARHVRLRVRRLLFI
jgi:hypothetical protein